MKNSGQKILCISFSDIRKDSRVLRQISVLKEYAEVHTLGYGEKPDGSTQHFQIDSKNKSLPETIIGVLKLSLRLHNQVELNAPAEKQALQLLQGHENYSLIVANDARAIPLAERIKTDTSKVWVDLHEWAIQENTSSALWKLLIAPYMDFLLKKYLGVAEFTTTVNDSIAKLYLDKYGVLPKVVRNSNHFHDLTPKLVDPKNIKLVHSGIAVPERNIEALIDAVELLDERFTLDLYLMKNSESAYMEQLKLRAASNHRIVFKQAVAPNDLVATLNDYDIGVYLLNPTSLNHKYMLPNKFFDYIQARLVILFSPTDEISKLVHEYSLGPELTSTSASELASVLLDMTPDEISKYKKSSNEVARQLSFETDKKIIQSIASDAIRV